MNKYLVKTLEFGEKNIEWFAMALGMFFLLYMTWTYIVTKPVSKALSKDVIVTPGTVDDTIDQANGEDLRKKMDVADGDVPKFDVKDFRDAVSTALAMNSTNQATVGNVWNFQPVTLNEVVNNAQTATPAQDQVNMLPRLPAPKVLFIECGKTTVGAAIPPPAPPAPGAPVPVPVPSPAPVAGAPVAGPPGNPYNLQDILWTTSVFSVPADPLAREWSASFGPKKAGGQWKISGTGQLMTQFLAVNAYRNEKMPDGTWGPDEPVPHIFNNPLPPYPAEHDKDGQMTYLGSSGAYAAFVTTPPFPNMSTGACGTVWKDPITVLQAILLGKPLNTPPAPIAIPAPAAPPPPPTAPGATPSATPAAPPAPQQLTPESNEPTIVKADGLILTSLPLPAVGSINPAALPPAPTVAPATPLAPGAPPVVPPPADILVYIHDDTVKPGKTYRYRVEYAVLNPTYNRPVDSFIRNKDWADKFALLSPKSNYTPEITLPLKTYFFCGEASNTGAGDKQLTFPFDVYAWGMGLWNKHTFNVSPGDQIGSVVNGIDYSTGYTYVDQRKHSAQSNPRSIVAMIDSEGNAVLRDAEQDFGGADHKAKNQWVDAQTGQTAGPAVPGPHVSVNLPQVQQLQQPGAPAPADNPDNPPP